MVYYHFPFINDDSETAAEASECAGVADGAGGFWRMVDSIYAQGSGIDPSGAREHRELAWDWTSACGTAAWILAAAGWHGRRTTRVGPGHGRELNSDDIPRLHRREREQTELEFRGGQEYATFSSVLDSILERVEQPSY